MGRRYRGPYARPSSYDVPYATAAVWGTGIDPIHAFYGEGPPLRVIGRTGAIGSSPVGGGQQSPRMREYQNPASGQALDPPEEVTWGYQADDYCVDSYGQGADASPSTVAPAIETYLADRPTWGNDAPDQHIRTTSRMPAWGRAPGWFNATRMGSHRYRRSQRGYYEPVSAEQSQQLPNETVSEGWENKATSFVADASPSADEQIFVQTSMRQRYGTRDNGRSVMRATDEERSTISSRVMPMVEKVYSEGERLFDMFPFQIDQIERPFRYRTAGLGRLSWMQANEINSITPYQRTPPPEPSQGIPEVQTPEQYGYTGEDTMYYG